MAVKAHKEPKVRKESKLTATGPVVAHGADLEVHHGKNHTAIVPAGQIKDLTARSLKVAHERSPARFLGQRAGKGPVRLSTLVSRGLSPKAAETLAGHLKMQATEFTSKYAHIPKQTLARRKKAGKLNVDESDRVARFARLLKQATDMMEGDQDAAIRWLKTPQILLEGESPLEYAVTETGASEVQQLIGRLEHGVYS